jgi:hypothetical protein
MWTEPRQNKLDSIPRLYQTEHTASPDKTIHAHFFLGACDWYICEYDGGDLFWGFACLTVIYLMQSLATYPIWI